MRVRIKNYGNSELIRKLTDQATLIKRTGMQPKGGYNSSNCHLGTSFGVSQMGGGTIFEVTECQASKLPNEVVVIGEKGTIKVSIKAFKEQYFQDLIWKNITFPFDDDDLSYSFNYIINFIIDKKITSEHYNTIFGTTNWEDFNKIYPDHAGRWEAEILSTLKSNDGEIK